ncbi:hypothetical protein [Cylindrospermum sp. FACHB-282]|uniref:hypothetical protein n=1 Tax=Cylindrospermum sp. FACHB-282 TaxID=2692794 RepID=UPI001688DF9D|nr:hypothetical protein [Cylindrospermum sp. FACHB-282]MBD2384215.1 hypothetical protein [Cylindrospermum sp. FACHB-282]
MILEAFYMKGLDDIDIVNLPPAEIQARTIAKNVSVIPTFFVYALFLPLLMVLHFCHQPSQEKVQAIIFYFLLKPIRWIWYKIVIFVCRLLISGN